MKPKTIKIIYWILTILFALAMTGDAIGGLTMQPAGQVVLKHLGYPMYNMPMYAVAKLLGVIAILQPWYRTIKEWAYAGFAFNFISAIASRAIMGDAFGEIVPAVVILIFLFFTYFIWKKYEGFKAA